MLLTISAFCRDLWNKIDNAVFFRFVILFNSCYSVGVSVSNLILNYCYHGWTRFQSFLLHNKWTWIRPQIPTTWGDIRFGDSVVVDVDVVVYMVVVGVGVVVSPEEGKLTVVVVLLAAHLGFNWAAIVAATPTSNRNSKNETFDWLF